MDWSRKSTRTFVIGIVLLALSSADWIWSASHGNETLAAIGAFTGGLLVVGVGFIWMPRTDSPAANRRVGLHKCRYVRSISGGEGQATASEYANRPLRVSLIGQPSDHGEAPVANRGNRFNNQKQDSSHGRTQAVSRLHAVLMLLRPGGMTQRLSADKASRMLRGMRNLDVIAPNAEPWRKPIWLTSGDGTGRSKPTRR